MKRNLVLIASVMLVVLLIASVIAWSLTGNVTAKSKSVPYAFIDPNQCHNVQFSDNWLAGEQTGLEAFCDEGEIFYSFNSINCLDGYIPLTFTGPSSTIDKGQYITSASATCINIDKTKKLSAFEFVYPNGSETTLDGTYIYPATESNIICCKVRQFKLLPNKVMVLVNVK